MLCENYDKSQVDHTKTMLSTLCTLVEPIGGYRDKDNQSNTSCIFKSSLKKTAMAL